MMCGSYGSTKGDNYSSSIGTSIAACWFPNHRIYPPDRGGDHRKVAHRHISSQHREGRAPSIGFYSACHTIHIPKQYSSHIKGKASPAWILFLHHYDNDISPTGVLLFWVLINDSSLVPNLHICGGMRHTLL